MRNLPTSRVIQRTQIYFHSGEVRLFDSDIHENLNIAVKDGMVWVTYRLNSIYHTDIINLDVIKEIASTSEVISNERN